MCCVQERQDGLGDCYVYFGNRYREKDFLYEKQWEQLQASGGWDVLLRSELQCFSNGE